MKIQQALATVLAGTDLAHDDMTAVMRQIMTGAATPAQIGGFLVGLRMKGETVVEVAAAAGVMRELADRVSPVVANTVDIVGTGGDTTGSFNISTASAIVAAAAGANIAKHGNRAVSSKSGAADLLEQAGVSIELDSAQVQRCVDEIGIGFMFAPRHHGAMKYAVGPRREMGIRTIFNILGPLTNPAGTPNQLLGVFDADWVRPLAEVLKRLGSNHVMVVHGENGLDEISGSGVTRVAELKAGQISEYQIEPGDFGIAEHPLSDIQVADAESSLRCIMDVLNNQSGAALDIVLLNAGAAVYVAGLADNHQAGIELARQTIASGAAREKLAQLAALSNTLAQQNASPDLGS